MQQDLSNPIQSEQFGMTEQEQKNYQYASVLGKLKYYFQSAEPYVVKILNALIYTTIKFIKTVVTMVVRMTLGKDV